MQHNDSFNDSKSKTANEFTNWQIAERLAWNPTKAMELYELIREKVEIPIHVLLRPRFGDFLYNEDETELMVRQARAFKKAGADAIVIGCLTKEGDMDW